LIKKSLVLLFSLFVAVNLVAQQTARGVIQLSGVVFTIEDGEKLNLPFVHVIVDGTTRGTYSNADGFFSIAVKTGTKLRFTSIGFHNFNYIVKPAEPGSLVDIEVELKRNTIDLPETIVYPWPSDDHFRIEFLELDTNDPLLAIAAEHLTIEKMEEIRTTMVMNAEENAKYFMRKEAQSYYHIGQSPPQNIFNPIAWAKFFKAIKKGEIKLFNN